MVKKEVSEILKIIICNCSLNFFKHKQIPKTSETRVKSPHLLFLKSLPSLRAMYVVNYKFAPPPRLFHPPNLLEVRVVCMSVGSTLRNLVERQGWNKSFQHTRIYSLFPRSSKVGEEIGQRSIWWQEKQVFYSA